MKSELGAIQHAAHDSLGRATFACALAAFIDQLGMRNKGYVIGLEGPWGSGKSSVIGMVQEELLHRELTEASHAAIFYRDDAKPLSLQRLRELAPLHQATSYDIGMVDLTYFTRDIVNRQHAQRATSDPALAVDLYRYFRLVNAHQDNCRNLVMVFQPWLIPESSELASVFIRELARTIGDRLGPSVAEALDHYRKAIEEIAPIAQGAMDTVMPGAGRILSAILSTSPSSNKAPPTLEDLKLAVEHSLRSLKNRKVVIVIDDLDRLTPKEAVQMVGLLKGLGRLPNVVYVVSYDESNLSKLIAAELELDGADYLEKIVQYKRRLPMLPKTVMLNLFMAGLEGITPPPIEGDDLKQLQTLWADIAQRHRRSEAACGR